jgi:outer membrane protein
MKNILRILLPAMLLVAFSVQAQTLKIATVDLGKVFTNFYKTKLAQADLDDRKNQIFKDENGMNEELIKGQTDWKALVAASADQSLSQDERDKKKQAADAKLKDLQDKQAALDQYIRINRQNLADQFQRMRDKLLAEIRETVNAKAKAGSYNLVIDSAAETVNATPVIVYNSGAPDLTEDVIKQLNVGAPIDLTKPVSIPAPTPMSPPSLLTTNRF